MVLQDLLAGGVEYVQDSQPSDADAGEIWLDTSVDPSALKIYDASSDVWDEAQASNLDAPVSNIQDELQSGRTRELLMLLQDKPVPEVVDPLNLQSGLSSQTIQYDNNIFLDASPDYFSSGEITTGGFTDTVNLFVRNQDSLTVSFVISGNEGGTASGTVSIRDVDTDTVLKSNFVSLSTGEATTIEAIGVDVSARDNITIEFKIDSADNFVVDERSANAPLVSDKSLSGFATDQFSAPTTEPADFKQWNAIQAQDVTIGGSTSAEPVEFDILNSNNGVVNAGLALEQPSTTGSEISSQRGVVINPNEATDTIYARVMDAVVGSTTAYVLQTNGAEIANAPIENGTVNLTGLDLSAGTDYYLMLDGGGGDYNFAEDTSPSFPYSSEKLDAVTGVLDGAGLTEADTLYNFGAVSTYNTRISKARIADEPFTMRNRVYSESAGSNGQSDYQIATTGDGGHFGIPILTVVSVKKNGSVLDSANWTFDGDTTVTIDTSNVTIASGDTIDIKYDFDVFDSTLQPRAYLSRESTSETSPSISHFRYEYVI